MNIIKTQPLGKKLLLPLLLTQIAAMGIGLSYPAQSTSPRISQSRSIMVKPKSTQILISRLICMKNQPEDELSQQARRRNPIEQASLMRIPPRPPKPKPKC